MRQHVREPALQVCRWHAAASAVSGVCDDVQQRARTFRRRHWWNPDSLGTAPSSRCLSSRESSGRWPVGAQGALAHEGEEHAAHAPMFDLMRPRRFLTFQLSRCPGSMGTEASSCRQPCVTSTSGKHVWRRNAQLHAPACGAWRADHRGVGWIRAADVGGSSRASAVQAAGAHQAAVHAAAAWIALTDAVRHSPKATANDSAVYSRVQLRLRSECSSAQAQDEQSCAAYAPRCKCTGRLLLCGCHGHCTAVSRRGRLCIRCCRCNHTMCRPVVHRTVSRRQHNAHRKSGHAP